MSDTELGAAISACHITSVDECYVNSIGKMPENDQAVTIPELVHEGAKEKQELEDTQPDQEQTLEET